MSDTNNNPVAPAIDLALTSQLAGICQAQAIVRLTAESLLEPEDFEVAAARAHEALNGAYTLLDCVLVHLEAIENQLRGEVTP